MVCRYNRSKRVAFYSRRSGFLLVLVAASFVATSAHGQPRLNEIMSSNLTSLRDAHVPDTQNCPVADCIAWYRDLGYSDADGDYPDWIEIFNAGGEALDLGGYALSDDPAQPRKWAFPTVVIPAEGFLVVLATGEDRRADYLHTNFKLNQDGETVLLTAPSGAIVDSVTTGSIPVDFTLGRTADQLRPWSLFRVATPGKANHSPPFPGFVSEVNPSHDPGGYSGPVQLALEAGPEAGDVYFSIDGSLPDPSGSLYRRPISIATTTVFRAQAWADGQPTTPVFTGTYLIDALHDLPVVSLTTEPGHLWDPVEGIYAAGRDARESDRIANYWRDWERPVHVELIETTGRREFAVNAGLQIFGWGSRSHAQKSLAIMIRDRYGLDDLDYPLFPASRVQTYHSFVLRAGGSDWGQAFLRDAFAQRLVRNRDVDQQRFRPAVVYVNGTYWGIQNIREKLNEEYLASHHGVDPDDVDIVSRYWRRMYPVVVEGDADAFLELERFLERADWNDPASYEELSARVDLNSLMDYMATEIYLANYDWPGNNNKAWRSREPGSRWRWLMYDLDFTMASGSNNGPSHNTLSHAIDPGDTGWPNPHWTTLVFRELIESPDFCAEFATRAADLANTIFSPDAAISELNEVADLFRAEMPRHIARWRDEGGIRSMASWEASVSTVASFLDARPDHFFQHLNEALNLSGTGTLTVESRQGACEQRRYRRSHLDRHVFPRRSGGPDRDTEARLPVCRLERTGLRPGE